VLGQKQQQMSLDIYNVSDDAQPAHATQVLIDGFTVSTRRIGNVLYVASTWAPDLSRYWPAYGTPPAQAQAAVAGLNASDLLPTIRVGSSAPQPLVAEQDCQIQPASASLSLQLTTITAIDLSTPALERRSRCFVGDGHTLYMSSSAAYVASSRNYWLGSVATLIATMVMPEQATTDIHKYALDGLQIEYRGSAEVTGHLGWDNEKAPYRMSEHQGDLRVLTFTGTTGWGGGVVATTPPSPATLTILREDPAAGRLTQVAKLPNSQRPAPLGHEGEQVYAVQFAGPRAYVVTFRRTDPLYVLDLADPADPKVAGELAMPGFSDYLFPLANGKLLGVGKDATAEGFTQGLKVALFDVGNPAQPLMLSSRNLGERGSTSALDYTRHGINILQQGPRARIALPVSLGGTWSGPQGLARFVVDTDAGTLEEMPMIAATPIAGTDNFAERYFRAALWNERSIQTTSATYYMSGGIVRYVADGFNDIAFSRVEGNFYGDWPAQNYVARTEAQWTQIWDQHDPLQWPAPTTPAVDFSAFTVVGLSLGWGPSGCHGLAITRITEEPAQLRVEYRRWAPQPTDICTASLVPLVAFVKIPATAKPVVFTEAGV
jgi:hypothetical protein